MKLNTKLNSTITFDLAMQITINLRLSSFYNTFPSKHCWHNFFVRSNTSTLTCLLIIYYLNLYFLQSIYELNYSLPSKLGAFWMDQVLVKTKVGEVFFVLNGSIYFDLILYLSILMNPKVPINIIFIARKWIKSLHQFDSQLDLYSPLPLFGFKNCS